MQRFTTRGSIGKFVRYKILGLSPKWPSVRHLATKTISNTHYCPFHSRALCGVLCLSPLKSLAENNYLMLMTNLSIEANSVDPDQTAPIGAV